MSGNGTVEAALERFLALVAELRAQRVRRELERRQQKT